MPGPYTYYVATAAGGGDNSHNGLYPTDIGGANGPWLTLANAATHMAAGDTLYIRGGTYQEATTWNSDGTEANPITITNYPDENPIIDGNNMTIPADEMAWIMDFHGDWYNTGGGTQPYVIVLTATPTDYHYDDFATYQSVTGWDTHGKWEDPKFVNAGGAEASDYRLSASSPCINAGANVGLTEDYFGNKVPQ
jgi:hypothetical protein